MRIIKILVLILVPLWIVLFVYLRNPTFPSSLPQSGKGLDSKSLESHVRTLTGVTPARMYKNPSAMFESELYIQKQFESFGYKVTLQDVQEREHIYHNIIVRYGDPDAKEVIVVGAHYDVAGKNNPGADDNASGVAVLLEIAKNMKVKSPQLNTAIEFVAYTLEEPPFFGGKEMGSSYHAESLKKNNVNVKFMLSLEMLGYYSEELFSQKFPVPLLYGFYPSVGNFIALVTLPTDRSLTRAIKREMAMNMETSVYSINAPEYVQGIDFSDHRSYWEYEWPAFMITDTAFLRNTQYHDASDTPDRLNYIKMADVGGGIFQMLANSNELFAN